VTLILQNEAHSHVIESRKLTLDAILMFQDFLIFKDDSGGRAEFGLWVRSGSLWVFKPEFIDSGRLIVESPRGNA
jgi:hypothetical protein